MNWIKNLKISQKLVVLICLGAFFVLLVSSLGYYYNNRACNDMDALYNQRLIPVKVLNENRTHLRANEANILYLTTTKNSSAKQKYIADIEQRGKKFSENIEIYNKNKLDQHEVETLAKLDDALEKYRDVRKTVAQMVLNGKSQEAYNYFVANNASFEDTATYLVELTDYNTKIAENINIQNAQNAQAAKTLLIVSSIASLVLLITLGLMISNMITGPITIAVDSLNEGSQQVSAAAMQVSSASQQLAEGSAEQASAIEETSSTLEESSSMVRQNTENTKQAAILAKQTKDSAGKGNKEMQEMMTSMEELKKSSDQIAKIIKVIDEIAFQTNILALNAAVEAARAGEAGMGFAVVAEEVRNLAQRSAQAAKDTAVIIESNIHLSEQGVEVSKNVNVSLIEIDTQAQKVSELLDEVAAASQEQAQGLAQINKAISQMEQVVQSNASTAEESASASEELSAQAGTVKEIVNSLVLLVEGADSINKQAQIAMASSMNKQRAIPNMNRRTALPATKTYGGKSAGKSTRSISPEDVIPLEDDSMGF